MGKSVKIRAMKAYRDVYHWMREASPGEWYTYATGFALTDSGVSYRVGKEMWQLAVEGRVYLVRRRAKEAIYGMFEYIAIKASDPPLKVLIPSDYGDPAHRGDMLDRVSGRKPSKALLKPKVVSNVSTRESRD